MSFPFPNYIHMRRNSLGIIYLGYYHTLTGTGWLSWLSKYVFLDTGTRTAWISKLWRHHKPPWIEYASLNGRALEWDTGDIDFIPGSVTDLMCNLEHIPFLPSVHLFLHPFITSLSYLDCKLLGHRHFLYMYFYIMTQSLMSQRAGSN